MSQRAGVEGWRDFDGAWVVGWIVWTSLRLRDQPPYRDDSW